MPAMRLFRSSVMASVAGVSYQTVAAWVAAGKLTPAATNEAGDPLWTADQLREQHNHLKERCLAEIDRATAALIEHGVIDEYEQQCDALRPVTP